MSRQPCVSVENDLDTNWYDHKKINDVLSHELRNEEGVVALDAIPLKGTPPRGSDNFKETLRKAVEGARQDKTVLMPININGNHWVGGMMKKGGDGKLKFFYNDSIGNKMGSDMSEEINLAVAEIEIIDLKERQQNDNYNCGPLTIHNLLEMSKAESLEEEELKKRLLKSARDLDLQRLRKNHSGLSVYESNKSEEGEVCSKMRETFKNLEKEGKISEENGNMRFDCDSSKDARELAEKIKESYGDLGVLCNLQEKDGQWIVKIPAACKGKDVFSMNSNDLKILRKEIQTEQSVAKENAGQIEKETFGKFTEMVQEKRKVAEVKIPSGRQ